MKTILKILVIVMLVLNLSGCWNRRELNELGIVLGVAVDDTEQEDKIEMTVQMVNAAEMESPGTSPYINLTDTGTDIMSIFRGFTHHISRKLYIAHNQVLIFGEDKAKKGVHDTLDFFLRDHEARLTTQILVAKGKGKDILDYEPHFSDLPASDIGQTLETRGANSQTPELMIFDFMKCLTSSTCCALAPIIEIQEKDDIKDIMISGTAVFKEDKMVGEMDFTETRGVLWVNDKVQSGVLRVKLDEQDVNLEIVKASGQLEPSFQDDGNIQFKIKIVCLNNIASFTGSRNITEKETIERLKEAVKKEIESEIQAAFEKSKKLKCDVFGFGSSIEKSDPARWKNLKEHWEEIYPQIQLEIETEVTIAGLGRLAKPDYPQKDDQ